MTETTNQRGTRALVAGAVAAAMLGVGAMLASPAEAQTAADPRSAVTVAGCNGAQITMEVRERDLLETQNAHRRSIGAPQLCVEPSLQRAAEIHAADMAAREFLEHRSPEGTLPSDRAWAQGYGGQGVRENIEGTGRSTTAQSVLQMWVDSPAHRDALEDGRMVHVGVSAADNVSSSRWVAVFGDGVPAPDPGAEVPEEPTLPASPAPAPAPAPNAAPVISALKPAQGSSTRDRTPLVTATVRDSATNLQARQVSVYVDGRRVKGSYSASTDRLRAQLPTLRPGKHTVKVTASDGSLVTTVARRFSVR